MALISIGDSERGNTFDGRCSVQEYFFGDSGREGFFYQRSVQEGWMPALREGEVTLLFVYATLLKCAFTMLPAVCGYLHQKTNWYFKQVLHHCVELLDP